MSDSCNSSGSGYPMNSNANVNVNNNVNGHTDNGQLNINHPLFNISVPKEGINNVAAALSSAGGATAGYQMAKLMGGSPAVKAGVALGTMATVQASSMIASKILNKKDDDDDDKNKFINFIFSDKDLSEKYDHFPLNLLPELNQLINIEIFFTLVIINVFIVRKLLSLNINFNRYLPDNAFGHFLIKMIQRYIKLWSASSTILLIISSICMITCILFSKVCMYYIITN